MLSFYQITIPRVIQQDFCSPQEGLRVAPHHQFEVSESFLEVPHFKMESIQSLKDVILPGDYLAKIDLQDAYLSVPMDAQSHPFVSFGGRIYSSS